MPYSEDAVGLMAHCVVYLYRNQDERVILLIRKVALQQRLPAQTILNYITGQANLFSRRHQHDMHRWDSGDINEMIARAPKGQPLSRSASGRFSWADVESPWMRPQSDGGYPPKPPWFDDEAAWINEIDRLFRKKW